MAIGRILTQGLGSFGGVNSLPTLGYSIGAAIVSNLYRWTGSAWEAKTLQYYNGSTWETKTLKRWNGSTWI